MTIEENKIYSNVDLLKFFIKNYKLLLVITITGALISVVVSLCITPEFKASTIIYPASTSSVSKALLTDITRTSKDVMKFGDENETEQLMQILQSDELKTRIITKYDLGKHYKLNKDSKYYKTDLLGKYSKNISCKKTEFQAVEIKVINTDPKMAAEIANDIASLLDSVYYNIQKDRAIKALEVVENVYKEQEQRVKQLEDSLAVLRQKGVFDYNEQSKALNEAYSKALSSGNQNLSDQILKKLQSLSEYGNTFNSLINQHQGEVNQLVFLKTKLTEAKVDAQNLLPHKFVIDKASIPEKKFYPKRSLIVIFSCISSFIFSLFLLLFIDRFNKVRKEIMK